MAIFDGPAVTTETILQLKLNLINAERIDSKSKLEKEVKEKFKQTRLIKRIQNRIGSLEQFDFIQFLSNSHIC